MPAPMTMTAASAADATVSTLTVRPSHCAVSWWPTSMAPSARSVSLIAVAFPSMARPPPSAASLRSFFQTGSAVETTSRTWNSARPNTTPRPAGRNTNATARPITVMISSRLAEFIAIFFFNGCASAVIAATERCTPTALSKPRQKSHAEENAHHRVVERARRGDRNNGQSKRDGEETNRPERNRGKHQRRVLRWRCHCCTSVLARGELPG